MEKLLEQKLEPPLDYKKFLNITRLDSFLGKELVLRFSVSENFTIFVTSSLHENLWHSHGVDPDSTLTEGEIFFDDNHEITKVHFKHANYQPEPGFKDGPEKLVLLQKAVEEILRDPKNKMYL